MAERRHPLAMCSVCPLNRAGTTYVASTGPTSAVTAFVGIAPGREEQVAKVPFVGPSGRLLNAVMANHRIERDAVFLTNAVSCIIGSSPVRTPSPATVGYRRYYQGPIVTLQTTNGYKLTVTPNHPILSDSGWLAAGMLKTGNDRIYTRFSKNGESVKPKINNGVPTAHEVFRALNKTGNLARVVGHEVDFHCDGIPYEQIEIVRADSRLSDTAPTFSLQALCYFNLQSRLSPKSYSASERPILQPGHPFGRQNGSSYSAPSSTSQSLSIAETECRRIESLSLCGGSPSDTEPFKIVVNSGFVDLESTSDTQSTLPAEVELSDIVSIVRTEYWFGHVYNFSTAEGWYEASGIIVHNCGGDDPTPPKAAIAACAPRLKAELESRPLGTIVALGNIAATAVLGRSTKITAERVGPPKTSLLYPGVQVIPTFHPAACLRGPDSFPHLVSDVGKALPASARPIWTEPRWASFETPFLAARALDELLAEPSYTHFAIDIETAYEKDASFIRPNQHPLLCLGLSYQDGKAIVLGRDVLSEPTIQRRLKQLLETRKLIGHNLTFDLMGLAHIGRGQVWFDTMLASYALDERQGTHKLKYLWSEHYGLPPYDDEVKAIADKDGWAAVPTDMLHKYNAWDCVATWRLWQHYQGELKGELATLNQYLTSAANALLEVASRGFTIDLAYLEDLGANLQASLEAQEAELVKWVDNPRSPLQVKAALADLGTLVDSTAADILRLFQDNDDETADLCNAMLAYRKEHKLQTTYVQGIKKRLFEGRCYSSFLLHGTTSGRISSRNPNLLNIPRDDKRIKRLFVPEQGQTYIAGDYAQLEARVVACLSQDPYLGEVFRDPDRDLFGELALEIFGDSWNKNHRQICKRVVHGSNYGMQPRTMAWQINNDAMQMGLPNPHVTQAQAGLYQQRYLQRVPQVKAWQDSIVRHVIGNGEDLVTPWGRHRRFWLITKENRYDVEHEALAFMPQSIASDICMTALIVLHKLGLDVRLSVYDSILVSAPHATVANVASCMRQTMEASGKRYSDYVPFPVEIQTSAQSWGDLQ